VASVGKRWLGNFSEGFMSRSNRQFLLLAFFVVLISAQTKAQISNYSTECSEKAKQLLEKAWEAQPMDVRGNNADPAKAELLYKEAIKESPKCTRATSLFVALLRRNQEYERANEYNELFLRQSPDNPIALDHRAAFISILRQDHAQALEIRMKLLSVEGFNSNGAVFYGIAGTYSLMNKLDESLEYLRLALSLDKTWGNEKNAKVDWEFENLRRDIRFWLLVNQK
jgi:tetratricopeptide (TPR) repeat protein